MMLSMQRKRRVQQDLSVATIKRPIATWQIERDKIRNRFSRVLGERNRTSILQL